jgi:hypothetical protein
MSRVELENGAVLESACECGGAVRKETIMRQYVMNGYPAGEPLSGGVEYFCAVCGKQMTASRASRTAAVTRREGEK